MPKTPAGKKLSKADQKKLDAENAVREEAELELASQRLAEQERLEKERKEEEGMLVPIEVPRFGPGDVRGMLVRTFQELYAEPNLGAPEEPRPKTPPPPPPEPEEEPPPPVKGGKKSGKKGDKGGDKAGSQSKRSSPEPPVIEEPVEPPPPTEPDISPEELALMGRIKGRTSTIQNTLEDKLRKVALTEDTYIKHTHDTFAKEQSRLDRYENHGLLLGVNVPGESSFFDIEKTLDPAGLVDLKALVKETNDRIIKETMPRKKRMPDRAKRNKSKQAALQEELKKQKELEMEQERLAKAATHRKTATPKLTPAQIKQRKERLRRRRMVLKELMPEHMTSENKQILRNMKTRVEFLKNPRFSGPNVTALPTAPVAGTMTILRDGSVVPASVIPEPAVVEFTDYEVGQRYTKTVLLRNRTAIGRRARLFPLSSHHFTTMPIQYHNAGGRNGLIAPGMCAELTVHFAPDALCDFEDIVVIATEAGRIELPVLGRRRRPGLTLSSTLDCGVCLVKDYTMFKFPCMNNGTNKGRYWVLDPAKTPIEYAPESMAELNDRRCTKGFVRALKQKTKEVEESFLSIGEGDSFTMKPPAFELDVGEAMAFEVLFHPSEAAEITVPLVIVCDNTQCTMINVRGYCWDVDLEITSIEDVNPATAGGSVDHLIFGNVTVTGSGTRTMRIKNKTPLAIPFRWTMDRLPSWFPSMVEPDEEPVEDNFFVQPNEGEFPPGAERTFVFTFIPQTSTQYRSKTDMWLDLVQKTETIPVKYWSFWLQGNGNPTVMTLDPPALLFGAPGLGVDTTHTLKLTITNTSSARGSFDWGPLLPARAETLDRHRSLGEPSVTPKVDGVNLSITPSEGELEAGASMELEVSVMFTTLDYVDGEVNCEVLNGDTLSLRFQSYVRGPNVRLKTPAIDFGLMNIGVPGACGEAIVELVNESNGPATFLFCQKGEIPYGFGEDAREMDYTGAEESWMNMQYFPQGGVLAPYETQQCRVRYLPEHECRLRTHLECHIKHSETQYVSICGEIQAPKLRLSPLVMELDQISGTHSFVGVERNLTIDLQNLTNLEATFQWEDVDVADFLMEFTPKKGTITGKEIKKINIRFIPRMPIQFNEVFACDIEGVKQPLPFKLRTNVHALEVSYHLEDVVAVEKGAKSPLQLLMAEQLPGASYHQKSTVGEYDPDAHIKEQQRFEAEREKKLDVLYPYVRNAFPTVDFGDSAIFLRKQKRLIIRNHTKIPTDYRLSFKDYACVDSAGHLMDGYVQTLDSSTAIIVHHEQTLPGKGTATTAEMNMNDDGMTTTVNMGKGGMTNGNGMATTAKMGSTRGSTTSISKRGGTRKRKQKRPKNAVDMKGLLTNTHETTQRFSSDKGKEYIGEKLRTDIEQQCLSTGKGVALFGTPAEGTLGPNEIIEVRLVMFNDMCGEFEDEIHVDVTGLPVAILPVKMKVCGSPLTFAPSNAGMSFSDGPENVPDASPLKLPITTPQPRLYWSPVPCESNVYKKRVKIDNSGPIDIRLHWHMFDTRTVSRDQVADLKLDLKPNSGGELDVDMNIVAYLPAEAKDFVLSVEPPDLVVPARGHATCYVSFDARALGPIQVDGFMEASMRLREADARRVTAKPNVDGVLALEDKSANGSASGASAGKTKRAKGSSSRRSNKAVPESTFSAMDKFEKTHIQPRSKAEKRKQALLTDQQKLLSTIAHYEQESVNGWVNAPEALAKNIFRLRLRASTVCPMLTWQRAPLADGALLKFLAPVPTVSTDYYVNTYLLEWNASRIKHLVTRGDMRDPALPPPPVNGVPFKEKAKDRKARLAREARELNEHKKSYGMRASVVDKFLPLSNNTQTILSFKMYCEPSERFKLGQYSSPNTSSLQGQSMPTSRESAITLAPGESMNMQVVHVPPSPADEEAWPCTRRHPIEGNVVVEYLNGFMQKIPLLATLLRPLLVVSPLFVDFANLHTSSKITLGVRGNERQAEFILDNPSEVPAAWKICHLPRLLSLKNRSAMDSNVLLTQANPEFQERYDWADEREVFKFDNESGVIAAQSKQTVTITFYPKSKQDYYSKFRFICPFAAREEQSKLDATCTVEILGTGRFDETLDHDYDHHY